jgi:hypothetical protein
LSAICIPACDDGDDAGEVTPLDAGTGGSTVVPTADAAPVSNPRLDAGVVIPDGAAPDVSPTAVTSTRGRLLVADSTANDRRLVVVDLDDGAVAGSFTPIGAAAVYSSSGQSPYAWANQRDVGLVEIIGSGIRPVPGGAVKESPYLLDSRLEAPGPTHWVSKDSWIVSFNDGDGSFNYVLESSLGTRAPIFRKETTGTAHHGVAVVWSGSIVATLPKPTNGDPALAAWGPSYPVGVTVRSLAVPSVVTAQTEMCPALHGEGANSDAVAFGCADGVLLVQRVAGAIKFTKVPNPVGATAGFRVGTVKMRDGLARVVGNWSGAGDNKYLSLVAYKDATPTIATITLPLNQIGFAIDDAPAPRIVVLTADGNMHLLNGETGAVIGTPLAVAPTTIGSAIPGSPVMTLGQGFAFVADPRDGNVTEVNLTTWQKGRVFKVGGKPNSVAAFGAWNSATP